MLRRQLDHRRTLLAAGLSACVLAVAGCGSSAGSAVGSTRATPPPPSPAPPSPSGAATFVGQATNAEILIQWTRAGDTLSGSLQQAIREERGSSAVESSSRAFTGTISGNGPTLTLPEGLGTTKALVGEITSTGFTMTFPGADHGLTDVAFVPGEVSDYNHAVRELEGRAEQGPSSAPAEATTTGTAGDSSANMEQCGTIQGPGARFAVTTDDNAGCPEARGVFLDLFAGKGEHHQGADEAETYTDVDGWSCGGGAGGYGCRRSGAAIDASAE